MEEPPTQLPIIFYVVNLGFGCQAKLPFRPTGERVMMNVIIKRCLPLIRWELIIPLALPHCQTY